MQAARPYRWRRAALAVVAAYALALQALLAGAAGAAHRASALAGMCDPAEAGSPVPHDPAGPHAGDCCILACHDAPLTRAAPPPGLRPARATWTAVLLPARAASKVATVPFLPLGSRAPPLLG
ncbi:MAG TPA: hypothetical protein VF601_06090 [Beijerinckiaceae bacterium]|jgi:hypothetical protein